MYKTHRLFLKKIIFDYAYIPVLTVHFVLPLSLKKIHILFIYNYFFNRDKKKLQILKEKNLFFFKLNF